MYMDIADYLCWFELVVSKQMRKEVEIINGATSI